MNYFTEEWLRVDLPVLARQGMQCSARLALEAIEDERKRQGELVEVVRLLMGSVEVFARDLKLRGLSGSASILDQDLRRARAAIADVTGAKGGGE